MNARTIIIGDVHGMLPELDALLRLVALSPYDHLVSVGDLLDKGPDSAGVVRYLRGLREVGQRLTLVRGNHEEKHERFRLASSRGGVFTNTEEMTGITRELNAADIAFLESAVWLARLPEHEALVVHAGLLPTMTALPSDADLATRTVKGFEKLCRVRHVTGKPVVRMAVEYVLDHDPGDELPSASVLMQGWGTPKLLSKSVRPAGSFVRLGEEADGDPFWAEVYDGRFGHVYFGHQPFTGASEPVRFPHATGLDLGAVFGGRLAAAVLEVERPVRFASVASRGKFADELWD